MNECTTNEQILGTVFNVQRFTIHDGPGVRTEFFLKGCPLRCRWCGNPESQNPKIEFGVYKKKCIGKKKCGDCLTVCPNDALIFQQGKLIAIDYKKCTSCGACYNICCSGAIKQWGEYMSVDDCMKVVRKDKGYYERSGGGVTISGGDPLGQADFSAELFKACQAEGYHTCFESDFFGSWNAIEKVLPYTDLFIADIKHMDDAVHRVQTGVSHKTIIHNLIKLSQCGKPIILRIPIIPKFNDSMENMVATADFITNELGGNIRTLQLLSYMRLGEEKYASLNRLYPMTGIRFQRKALQDRVSRYAAYFNSRGIHCLVGTKEKQ